MTVLHPEMGFDCYGPVLHFISRVSASGIGFHGGYYGGASGKDITSTDLQAKQALGIASLSYFESGGNKVEYFSAEQGKCDADQARNQAMQVKQPLKTDIFFSVDCDPSQQDLDANILPYFRAVNEEMGGAYIVDSYGSGLTCGQTKVNKLAVRTVLGAIGWRQGHAWLPNADVVQKPPSDPYHYGIQVDPLFAQTRSPGLWNLSGPVTITLSPQPLPIHNRVLMLGDVGDDVRVLQGKLGVTVDGIFGQGTKAAVIAFQQTHSLSADGIVGDQTRAALSL